MMHSTKTSNRLIDEKSPYLLQHAYNPVHWLPWSEEAFVKAKQEDKPIFLSIGYSACHWCHVMAEESFENQQIADLLNERFVSIKVDREQRPDVDAFYMQACVALQGQGGWPLSAFLMSNRQPFYAGTYYPPGTNAGEEGFYGLLVHIADLWRDQRSRLAGWADQLFQVLSSPQATKPVHSAQSVVAQLEVTLTRTEDRTHGGLAGAPKFPNAPLWRFLMRRATQRSKDDPAWQMTRRALLGMALGGIHDHAGHGFFRYTVDDAWRLPHFEKMLQDNALLAQTYLEASALDPSFSLIARDALDYLCDTLMNEWGGFFSSQDADDPMGEGAYYLWTPNEVQNLLGLQDGARCCALLGLDASRGIRPEAHAQQTPHCDPKTGCTLPNNTASGFLPYKTTTYSAEDEAFLSACLPTLRKARAQRPAPRIILLSPLLGNGLAIAALATAARQLQAPEYLPAAKRAAAFIEQHMTVDGRLMGSWSAGRASCPATVDGYAAWVWGLLRLEYAEPKNGWLQKAEAWHAALLSLFQQEDQSLALTGKDMQDLPMVQQSIADDAMPSGTAMCIDNLAMLHQLTGKADYEAARERLLNAVLPYAAQQPTAHAALFSAACPLT